MADNTKSTAGKQLSLFLNPDKVKPFWYIVFGLSAAVTAFAAQCIIRLLAVNGGNTAIPDFLYSTYFGYCYLFVFASLLVVTVLAFAYPKCFEFRGLFNNRWYYLTRMGYSSARLVSLRILSNVMSILLSYAIGTAAGAALCAAVKLDFPINGCIVLILFGLTAVLLMTFCLMAAGAVGKNRGAIPIVAVAYTALLFCYIYLNGGFEATSRYTLSSCIARLMTLDGATFLLLAGVVIILMNILIYTSARDKAAFNVPSLPRRVLLERMGVAKDDVVALMGKKDKTLAEGGSVMSKKEQRKQDTLMVSLGEVHAQLEKQKSAEQSKAKTPPRKKDTSGTQEQSETDGQKIHRPFGRLLLTAVLIFLCILSYCGAAVCFVANGAQKDSPKQLLGFYAVYVADDTTFEGLKTGDLALFKSVSTSVAQGRIILYKTAGAIRYGTVSAVEADGSYTVQTALGLVDVQPANLLAVYFTSAGISSIPSGNASSIAACAAVLLTGCLLLSIVVKAKERY